MTDGGTVREDRNESFSVVVVPSGDWGAKVLEVAERWYAAGLLSAAAWVRPEDVRTFESAAPVIRCHLLGAEVAGPDDEPLDLFEVLGRRRRGLVRVVRSQVLPSRESIDVGQLAAADAVRTWISQSLPGPIRGEDVGVGTDIRSINLMTGTTGVSELSRKVLSADWDVNAVTSPEDRPDPARANRFIRAESNLVPVALLSTATVAGLISAVPEGPFDEAFDATSAVLGKVLVVRPTVRAVLGGPAIAGLAQQTCLLPPAGTTPAQLHPDRYARGSSATITRAILEWLETIDSKILAASDPDDQTHDDVLELMSVRSGAGMFLRFAGQSLRTMVTAPWGGLTSSAERVVTKAMVGTRSGRRLVFVPTPDVYISRELVALELEDIQYWDSALGSFEAVRVRVPTLGFWRQLRNVLLSSLDGGDLPSGAPRELDGSRILTYPAPTDVVPAPDDEFVVDDRIPSPVPEASRVAGACAPDEARAVRQTIRAAAASAQEALRAAEEQLRGLGQEPSEPPEPKVHRKARKKAEAAVLAAADRASTVEAEVLRFDRWFAEHSSSLLWQLSERIESRRVQAASREASARAGALESAGIDESLPRGYRRRFLAWSWGVVAALPAGMVLIFGVLGETTPRWRIAVVWMLICAIALLLVIRRWYTNVLAYAYESRQGWRRRADAAGEFRAANLDRRRFDAIQSQLDDWIHVLGWTIHRPWTVPQEAVDPASTLIGENVVPAALVLAEPRLTDRARATVVQGAQETLVRPGWRQLSYRRLVSSRLPAEEALDAEMVAEAVDRVDGDDGRGAGALVSFRHDLDEGGPQVAAGEIVQQEVRDSMRGVRLAVAGRRLPVAPLDPRGGEVPSSDAEFLRGALAPTAPLAQETWSDRALVKGAHEDITSHRWLSESEDAASAERKLAKVVSLDALSASALVGIVVRIDRSRWLDAEDLRLFAKAPAVSRLGDSVAPDDDDDPVFT